jgi:hypothetical protein
MLSWKGANRLTRDVRVRIKVLGESEVGDDPPHTPVLEGKF